MVVALIIACEVGFWVLLALGLAVRYLLKWPRTSVALLLCEPVLELVLFAVTAVDLKNGAEPSWEHGLAALYIGYTVAYGHYTIAWLDGHAAHRLAGGPPPPKPPRYGMARARYEGGLWLRTLLAVAVACAVLQGAVWYVGDGDTSSLRAFQWTALRAAGIHGLVALTYVIRPKKAPQSEAPQSEAPRSALPTRDPEHVPDVLVRRAGKDAALSGGQPPDPRPGASSSAFAARHPQDVADLAVRRASKDEQQVR